MALKLKQSPYVREFLACDFGDQQQYDDFMVKWHPGLQRLQGQGLSSEEVLKRARHHQVVMSKETDILSGKQPEDKRLARIVNVVEEGELGLPDPGGLQGAQEILLQFIEGVSEMVDEKPAVTRRPIDAALEVWNHSFLGASQPVVTLTERGQLQYELEVTGEKQLDKGGLVVKAWLELLTENVVDPTAAQISQAATKAEARAIADELWEAERDRFTRRFEKAVREGEGSEAELAERWGINRSTMQSRRAAHKAP